MIDDDEQWINIYETAGVRRRGAYYYGSMEDARKVAIRRCAERESNSTYVDTIRLSEYEANPEAALRVRPKRRL